MTNKRRDPTLVPRAKEYLSSSTRRHRANDSNTAHEVCAATGMGCPIPTIAASGYVLRDFSAVESEASCIGQECRAVGLTRVANGVPL